MLCEGRTLHQGKGLNEAESVAIPAGAIYTDEPQH